MSYKKRDDIVDARGEGYCRFWGREADEVTHQINDAIPHIDVFRFPVVDSPKCKLNDLTIYVTGGMSDVPMPGMDEFDESLRYAEVTAYAYKPMRTESGKTDFIAWICHWMAHFPFEQNTYFLSGQTFDWGAPIVSGSKMEGFYFANTPFVDRELLIKDSVTATTFIHLVPISRREIEYAKNKGRIALVELFGKQKVSPIFDLARKCIISKG